MDYEGDASHPQSKVCEGVSVAAPPRPTSFVAAAAADQDRLQSAKVAPVNARTSVYQSVISTADH